MRSAPAAPRKDALWSQVHALAVIAQVGSFTLAAQRLGLSKAAVSQRIAELERAVGATLLRRTTRSVRLTAAGQQMVDGTAASFAHIEQSVDAVRDLAGAPRGIVRVTAPVALGRQHVAPALEQFLRLYPEIRVELDLSDHLVSLAREGFDLAIRHTSAPPDSHVAWKLCDSRALLVASARYLRRHGTPRHPLELAAHNCIPYLRPAAAEWLFERATSGAKGGPERVSVNVRAPLRVNNSEVVRDAALAGLGIGLLPDFSAAAALRGGKLRELLTQWRPVGFFGDAIYAVRPWGPGTPRSLRLLLDHLKRAFRGSFLAPASASRPRQPGAP